MMWTLGYNPWKALVLILLQCNWVASFQPDRFLNAGDGKRESLEEFRKRRGITFNYNTTTLHPEYCRHMNQSLCEDLDSRARRLQSFTRPFGTQKVLVLLLKVTNSFPTISRDSYDLLFNDRGMDAEITPSGSVFTYLRDNSQNQFLIDAYVHDWVDAEGGEAACAGSNGQQGAWQGYANCWVPALRQLDAKHEDGNDPFNWLDFDQNGDGYIDNLIVIYNGYDAGNGGTDPAGTPADRRILAHQGFVAPGVWQSTTTGISLAFYATASAFRSTQGDQICRFNFILHEFLHTFGAIDLYDFSFNGNGVGGYDIMAFPVGQGDRPRLPGNVGPYTKILIGWLNPIEILQDGRYPANPSFTSNQVYRISQGFPPGEFLLIENRQPLAWDERFWGGGGIVIWSIDEDALQNDATQTRVKIVQADGREDLENGRNMGDADDLWIAGRELDDNGFPNTRSRRTGASTGLRIWDFTPTQTQMEFTVGQVESPSASPSSTPVPTGTPEPTAVETPDPTGVDTQDPTGVDTSEPTGTTAPPTFDQNSCAVSLNTEECPLLLAATTPQPGCDCYNYCGNALLDCCAFGADCPLRCTGNGGENPAIVAGCVFPPPTEPPTQLPTNVPTEPPTQLPTTVPTMSPTSLPTATPTSTPTSFPTTEPPTMNPTTVPPVSDPPTVDFTGKCQISVNVDQCDTLMRGQPEIEGCECYNFCDGAPLECCALGEKCPPINCESTDFVAGCSLLEPTMAPTGGPECLVQVSTGQCSELMEDVTPFPACDCYNFCNGAEIGCCRFDAACPVSCTGDFVAGCTEDTPTPPPEPEPMCLTSVNTELCSFFTGDQVPRPDCDCYNYCNGQEVGCCPLGELCEFECNGVAVAGCQLEPRCSLVVNTDQCAPLVAGQQPDPNCDCYNYCDGEFRGCCAFDEFCSLQCPNTAPENVVAGCRLDATPAPVPAQSTWPVFFWPDGFTAPRRDAGEGNNEF